MGIGLGEFVIVLLVAFIIVGPEDSPESRQNIGALGQGGKKNDERYQWFV